MIRIEVADDTKVHTKSGTSKNGKGYTIHEQTAYAHVLDEEGRPAKYPVPCRLPVEDEAKPYKQGFYTLDPRSIFVGDYGRLEVGRARLAPAVAGK